MKKFYLLLLATILFVVNSYAEDTEDFVIENGVLKGYTGPGGDVVIPDGVEEIEYNFSLSNITSISIPASVKIITEFLCLYAPIERYIVNDASEQFSSENGVLYNKDKSVLIKYPSMSDNTTFTIPDEVISVETTAFYAGAGNLKHLIIPCEIENLGMYCNLFNHYSKLETIEITGTNELSSIPFCVEALQPGMNSSNISNQTLIVPIGMKDDYKALDNCSCAGRIIEKGETVSDFQVDDNGVLINYWGTDANITIPDDVNGIEVKKISYMAFNRNAAKINTVTIPESVSEIEPMTFVYCTQLSDVNVSQNNSNLSSQDGVLYNKDKSKIVVYPREKNGDDFAIPGTVEDIEQYAFAYSKLKNITGIESIKTISASAFLNCANLTSITIPDVFTEIQSSTFSGCNSLSSVTLPDDLIKIGDYAFAYCSSLTSINIPSTVNNIGNNAFGGTGLTSIIIPESVNSIGEYAFSGCQDLANVSLPTTLTELKAGVFENCKFTSIAIPSTVTIIGELAFWNCQGLTSIEIPSSVTTIGQQAFSQTNISLVKIPVSVVSIGELAFYTDNLSRVEVEWITIPNGIESKAFSYWDGYDNIAGVKLVVPFGTEALYKSTVPWKHFGTIEEKAAITQLNISPTAIGFDAPGGARTFGITSNVAWTVSSSESWATINTASGSNNATITLSVSANTSAASRFATVTITGGGITKTVNVSQAKLDDTTSPSSQLNISTDSLKFDAGSGTKTFGITSNVEWILSSSASWATINISAGSNNATITVSVSANTSAASRSAFVIIAGVGLTKSVIVTQAKAETGDEPTTPTNPKEEENEILATPSQPADNKGLINLSLSISSNQSLNGEFIVSMPGGFNLDKEKTALAPELQSGHSLDISDKAKGVWAFKISTKTGTRSASDATLKKIVDIAYTIDENVSTGNYKIQISDLDFKMSDNSTIKEDDIDVSIPYSTVGNGLINGGVKAVCYNNTLSISSLYNEKIEIYSIIGTLVFSVQKTEGEVKYDISDIPKGIVIVKGSSGWVEKVIKK